ncbi:MAG TPA: hypothetical protein VG944_05935 [Fimbriimonas sp.]|nr:hypothetical protein [Fimbriimonas sp.]
MRLVFLMVAAMAAISAHASGITLVTSPSWGIVVAPSSGTTNYALSTSTGLVSVLSGSGLSLGGSVPGEYLLSGLSGEPISWSVSIASFGSGSGVSAVQAYGNGTSSSGSMVLNLLGTGVLNVGGVLGVSSGANGLNSAVVTVSVNFQ